VAKKPNKETQKKYKEMVEFGCVVCKKLYGVHSAACIHHFTGAGMGLKDIENFIPLCHTHHQGKKGIHHLGRFTWEDKFGKQKELLDWYEENKHDRD
tara:strand:- start:455 stop:745 length:291 start_codon:yes stop_codon:yes gene_type:complete